MIPREELGAFADGELPAEAAARVAAEVEADPAQAAALERLRALRRQIAEAYAQATGEPPAPRTEAMIRARLGPDLSNVVSFRPARSEIRRGLGGLAWTVLVLLLLLAGMAAGGRLARGFGDPAHDAVRGALARGLDRATTGRPLALRVGRLTVTRTFSIRDGSPCRQFRLEAPDGPVSGLACRDARRWRLRALVNEQGLIGADYGADDAARAGGSVVAEMARVLGAGPTFDAAAETRWRKAGWDRRRVAAR
ncbi:MAG: hypothetical protein ACOY4K_10265 [Pseudomonadota bacterium]